MVHVASISHQHGVNFYVSKTKDGLLKQLFDFCWEYKSEAGNQAAFDDAYRIGDQAECVSAYFQDHPCEYLDMSREKLEP